jgi:uncharacterized cupin superfamily protein
MTPETPIYAVDRADADGFEPFTPAAIPAGELHWLRRADPPGAEIVAAIWRAEPCTFDYLFDSDEACYVIEGEATVELLDRGETVPLRAGDIAWFPAGTRAIWHVTQAFRKFVVGPAPPSP